MWSFNYTNERLPLQLETQTFSNVAFFGSPVNTYRVCMLDLKNIWAKALDMRIVFHKQNINRAIINLM